MIIKSDKNGFTDAFYQRIKNFLNDEGFQVMEDEEIREIHFKTRKIA